MTCAACSPQRGLSVIRGESKTFLVTVRDAQRNPIDLTACSVWFSVKNRLEDVGPVITKRNAAVGGVDNQILITVPQTGAAIGQLSILIDPADTAALDPEGSYVCDAWVQLTNTKRYQVLTNRPFNILPAVTTAFPTS
jgi:hypothetical protein